MKLDSQRTKVAELREELQKSEALVADLQQKVTDLDKDKAALEQKLVQAEQYVVLMSRLKRSSRRGGRAEREARDLVTTSSARVEELQARLGTSVEKERRLQEELATQKM